LTKTFICIIDINFASPQTAIFRSLIF
jgi:hypothetical protein